MAHILLVEDDQSVRKALRRVFRDSHDFVEAVDGETGLKLADREEFDIALVDYGLGRGINGIEVLSNLQRLQPDCARLLMTGDHTPEVVQRALNSGAVLYIVPKPFRVGEVEVGLQRALQWLEVTERGKRTLAERRYSECATQDHLRLAVQPIVTATNPHRPVAFECLLRSTHPTLKGPLDVVDNALAADRICDLGAEVNRMAAAWARRLPADTHLFVNVHARQFSDPNLIDRFAPLLPIADRVVLEITEAVDVEAVANGITAIESLARLGFSYALDDVGAGANGLRLLAILCPTFIKVDMSFVRNIHLEPRKQRLVELLGRFAAADNSRVVAEGVETADEVHAVTACGAQLLQGYYFARPTQDWPPPASA